MVLRDYEQFGGKHCETASLKNVLAHMGVVAPHTGRPFTEEMLLGIGGGIGVMYWVFQSGGTTSFFLGTRYSEKGPGTGFVEQIAARLGLEAVAHETASAKQGAAVLEAALAARRPAVVWADMPMLPYLAIPESAHFGGHAIVVYGIEDGRALIADRAARPVSATIAQLAAARASKFKPFPPKHGLLELRPPGGEIGARTLERAVVRGISDSCRQLLRGPIRNIGLGALPKWAALVADRRNAKGWPNLFRAPVDLYGALMSTFIFIEIGGTGGGGFRSMYASFLSEAAAVLNEPLLEQTGCLYRDCARLWSEVARAALPDWAPELRETRDLLARKNRAFEEQGEGARDEMLRINRRLEKILAGAKKRFPAPAGAVPKLLDGLRECILRLYEAEVAAARTLEACMV